MQNKPLYGKILASRSFPTRAEAERFAKDMKEDYREGEMSLKYDINRTPDSEWKATIYVKI